MELPPVPASEEGGGRPRSRPTPTRVLYPASKKAQRTLEEGLQARAGPGGEALFEVVRLNTYDTVPAEWGEEETVCVFCWGRPSCMEVLVCVD